MAGSWCTSDEVAARLTAGADLDLCQEYAELATSTLYVMTGRKFAGESTVISMHEINRRGYAITTAWLPVRALTEATIDDEIVTAFLAPGGTYVVFNRVHVGRMAKLTLEVGQNPPISGKRAAAALAADLVRGDSRYAAGGATDTRPSPRLQSVSRQGVTYTYIDPTVLAEKNMTGVTEVDTFIAAVNPSGAQYQPKVVTL
jgi:hypothetical protein